MIRISEATRVFSGVKTGEIISPELLVFQAIYLLPTSLVIATC